MPKIRSISIKNFRSIIDLTMKATDLTVIVGDNDCGKSNVLRALNLFFNEQTNPDTEFNFSDDHNRFAELRPKRAPEIEVQLDLELPHSYRQNNGDIVRWRKRWREDGLWTDEAWGIRYQPHKRGTGVHEITVDIEGRSRVPALLSKIQFEYVPAVRSADFFRTLRGRIFQVIANSSEQSVRRSSGEFEAAISTAIQGLLTDIGDALDDAPRLSLPNDLTHVFQSLDFLAGEKGISLDSRGDGIKARYIPLILKFIAERSRDAAGIAPTFIWAYEEPENNLEFRRAQALADAFWQLAEDETSQVLLTTHSPVFYNMHLRDQDDGLCSAYHLTKAGPETGTVSRSASEANISLDESMGAMAIIAPHIRAAQGALAEATAQAEDLRTKLAQHNQANLPTMFVEGATDYRVFRRLLDLFRPSQAQRVFLAEPPQRAGANYVANMLRSWEFRTKHLDPQDRRPAVGIVDCDAAGLGACERFGAEGIKWKHVSLLKLKTPARLAAATELGVQVPVTLEELWPAEVWNTAEARGWLVARPIKGHIGERLLTRLVERNERLSDLLEDDWRIYLERRVDDDAESTAKSDWAAYIAALPRAELERICDAPLAMLDEALAKVGVT